MMKIKPIGKQECKTALVKYFSVSYNEVAHIGNRESVSQNNI